MQDFYREIFESSMPRGENITRLDVVFTEASFDKTIDFLSTVNLEIISTPAFDASFFTLWTKVINVTCIIFNYTLNAR